MILLTVCKFLVVWTVFGFGVLIIATLCDLPSNNDRLPRSFALLSPALGLLFAALIFLAGWIK